MSPQRSAGKNTREAQEATPLLADDASPSRPAAPATTPLPKRQLATLTIIRLSDPICFTQIFPYVNEMIWNFGITDDESRIGLYSGILESSFALTQVASIYHWGQLSDVIGRRPAILWSVAGLGAAALLLGFFRSFTGLLLCRILAGLFSGSVAVIYSALGEMTDHTNAPLAFPMFAMAWPIGAIVGPLLGGSLSSPAKAFPRYFDMSFWRTYPYLLPCLVTAIITAVAVLVGYIWLVETHPLFVPKPQRDGDGAATVSAPSKSPVFRELLAVPMIRAVSSSGFMLSLVATCHNVVFPLFCYSPVQHGGLGMSVAQIGYSLAVASAISFTIQLLVMPPLLRVMSCDRLYSISMAFWPPAFALLPPLHIAAKQAAAAAEVGDADRARCFRALMWAGVALVLVASRAGLSAFALNMILVKEAAPTPAHLVGANSLTQVSMSTSRGIAPAFISTVFAMTADRSLFGGYTWAIVAVLVSLLNCKVATWISYSRTAPRERVSG